jgi:hypothetical protein
VPEELIALWPPSTRLRIRSVVVVVAMAQGLSSPAVRAAQCRSTSTTVGAVNLTSLCNFALSGLRL